MAPAHHLVPPSPKAANAWDDNPDTKAVRHGARVREISPRIVCVARGICNGCGRTKASRGLARRRSQRATGATRPGPGGHTGRAIPPDAAQSAGSALAAHGHPVQSGRGVTVSQALEQPVAQLHHELQRASVCHADETRHQSHSHTLWRGYWSVGGASSPHDLACGMHHQLKLLAIFLMAKHPRPVFVKGMPIVESFFHLKTATFSLQLRWHPYQAQLYCDFGFGLKFGFFIQPPCSWTWARLFSQ